MQRKGLHLPGFFTDGFRTNVLPHVTAIGNICRHNKNLFRTRNFWNGESRIPSGHTHKEIIAGKFKGHIPAQTPRGSLIQKVSTPLVALGINSPICRVAIPHDCSTTSTSKARETKGRMKVT